jgi:hypothetical protein
MEWQETLADSSVNPYWSSTVKSSGGKMLKYGEEDGRPIWALKQFYIFHIKTIHTNEKTFAGMFQVFTLILFCSE